MEEDVAGAAASTKEMGVRNEQDDPLALLTIPDPPDAPQIPTSDENLNSSINLAFKRSRSDSAADAVKQLNAAVSSSSTPKSQEEERKAASSHRRTISKGEPVVAGTARVTFANLKRMPRGSQSSSNVMADARRRSSADGGAAPSSANSSPYWGSATTTASSSRVRIYRSAASGPDKLTTRDIAALDFLLGIPLEAEESIVQHGWMLQQRRKKTYHFGDDDTEGDDADDDWDDTTRRNEDQLEPPGSKVATTAQLGANSYHGRWWEKWVPRDQMNLRNKNNSSTSSGGTPTGAKRDAPKHAGELELPMASSNLTMATTQSRTSASSMPAAPVYAPGRRLEGDEAILVQIPLKIDTMTRQKSIARQAAIREWEIKVAHGLMGMDNSGGEQNNNNHPHHHQALLDGRLFLSAAGSYPLGVFSLKRYEPKREEAALRRQKLEARGGGGSQFVMPSRDWRGITFRALLPRKAEQKNQKSFNRFLRNNKQRNSKKKKRTSIKSSMGDESEGDPLGSSEDEGEDSDSDASSVSSSSSSSSEDSYIPGILDDPEMTLGRHRNVMIGDYVTGCIVASTIQFVKPALLKADLNQKFRERFDGWEPGKSQRKYIGAKVVDGVYTLIDPTTETTQDDSIAAHGNLNSSSSNHHHHHHHHLEPPTSPTAATPAIIRMPPSLTLSKIRSVKRQALMAFVKANLDIGTMALACVYFERLCLSCRVDKTNRRLCFASCLLLASKINEPNDILVIREDTNLSGAESGDESEEKRNTNARKKIKRLQSSIRPNKRSTTMFAFLLEFFTQEWNLSLKHLFAAEWGVFAALRFSLHAKPSQVAFHFKRLMKTLEWAPRHYLGKQMYAQWQEALATEEDRVVAREERRELRQVRKERRLQRELQKEVIRGKQVEKGSLLRRKSSKGKSSAVEFQDLPALEGGTEMKIAVKKKSKAAPADLPNTPPESTQTDDLAGKGRQFYLAALSRSPNESPKRERLSLGATQALRTAGGDAPPNTPTERTATRKPRPIKLLSRFGMYRASSHDKLSELAAANNNSGREGGTESRTSSKPSGLPLSPSMPIIPPVASFPGLQEDGDDEPQPEPSTNSSVANNLNESRFIDMPPDSPPTDRQALLSDDEEKGLADDNEAGIVF